MKAILKELLQNAPDALAGRNLLREYLQARILGAMQKAGAMIPLAFHGGTALRFLHRIPRYSEDLDFTLERPNRGFDFRGLLQKVQDEFHAEGYAVELRIKDKKTVLSAFVRFRGLLFELKLSPRKEEVLAIKLEVDTNPPAGAELETTLIRRFVTLQLQHHDRASLLAGKCHAVLQRTYTKGRDLFDLLWYLSDPAWPEPNLVQLNNALTQSGWKGPELSSENWRKILADKVRTLDWSKVKNDVRPFLETSTSSDLLTQDNLLKILKADL